MLRAALVLLGCLALGYVGVGLLVVYRMTAPRHRAPEATPADVGLAYEEAWLESTDAIRLKGWWVPTGGSPRTAVLVHGWGGDKSN